MINKMFHFNSIAFTLIRAMHTAFAEGRNAMQQARDMLSAEQGSTSDGLKHGQ